jgi:small subunit ribosomal protein S25e|tara:strand:+ start:651 stop:974 length:324 start_codon:yes stop_codon:yes gene_type:complete
MPPKTQQKSKAQKMAAAQASKGKKKKWSKGKSREKSNAMVLFDKDTYERLYKEVPKMKVVTISNLSERLKLNGSLARAAIKELTGKGLLKVTYSHRGMIVATSAAQE